MHIKGFLHRATSRLLVVLMVFMSLAAAGAEAAQKRQPGLPIIRDAEIHQRVVTEVGAAFASLGCTVRGVVDSPIKGAQGNTEFLMCLDIGATDATPND